MSISTDKALRVAGGIRRMCELSARLVEIDSRGDTIRKYKERAATEHLLDAAETQLVNDLSAD